MYFKDIDSLEDLKKQYKKLALKHHPDRGGDEEVMKAINNEYDELEKELKKGSNIKDNLDDSFKDIINELMKYDIEIEVIGTWIWISGDTKPIKNELKNLGFKWHGSKKMWFFHDGEFKRRYKKELSIEEIRERHGNYKVKKSSNENKKKLA